MTNEMTNMTALSVIVTCACIVVSYNQVPMTNYNDHYHYALMNQRSSVI